MMQKRHLGPSKLEVSAIGLGCMGMSISYGATNDAESIKTLHRALDLGITLLDTADMYGWGHNEELIGKAIKGHRDKIVLATKMGFIQGGEKAYTLDGSPAHIKAACDASLKRLGVETIDLYYLHRIDPKVSVEDSISAMAELVKAGKIRHIGISEAKPETIRRAAKVHPITALQTEYSLWERNPEKAILSTCRELKIGFVPFSPLGRGFLTGKISDMTRLAKDDFRHALPKFNDEENFETNKTILRAVTKMAHEKRCSTAQLALAWLLAQGEDIVPIPGTKKVAYLEENLGALEVQLSQDELKQLDRLVASGKFKGEKFPAYLNLEN